MVTLLGGSWSALAAVWGLCWNQADANRKPKGASISPETPPHPKGGPVSDLSVFGLQRAHRAEIQSELNCEMCYVAAAAAASPAAGAAVAGAATGNAAGAFGAFGAAGAGKRRCSGELPWSGTCGSMQRDNEGTFVTWGKGEPDGQLGFGSFLEAMGLGAFLEASLGFLGLS
eukprot:4778139-Pyramimonas_sp.AAC.1